MAQGLPDDLPGDFHAGGEVGGAVAQEGEEGGPVGFFHDAGGLDAGDDGEAVGMDQFHGAVAGRADGARAVIDRHVVRKAYAGVLPDFDTLLKLLL